MPKRSAIVLFIAFGLVFTGNAPAQPVPQNGMPLPRLQVLTPCGAKLGSVVEVSFQGQDCQDPTRLIFSHAGIRAEPIIPPADPKKPGPQPVTRFKVTVDSSVPVGLHEVRLVNHFGISNCRAFAVGDLHEAIEREPNNDVVQAQRVELQTTITGSIATPVDVDYFQFPARRGQRVVLSAQTISIDSRLQASLVVYDLAGRAIAASRPTRAESMVDVLITTDGDYVARIGELAHLQGSPEHFYRLSISTAPFIDAVIPSIVEPGKTVKATVLGRNLPGGLPSDARTLDGLPLERLETTITAPTSAQALLGRLPQEAAFLDGFELRLRNAAGSALPYWIKLASAKVENETEPNNSAEKAQKLGAPCEVSGAIDKPGDRDWYRFTSKKGEVFRIEALSRRIGTELDLAVQIQRADNKQVLAEGEDTITSTFLPDLFDSRTSDPPTYRLQAPADGEYLVKVASRDAAKASGPQARYHLRIVREAPNFRLLALPVDTLRPGAAHIGQGGNTLIAVLALREDGFEGPIDLQAEGLPPGVVALPQSIGPKLPHTLFVLSGTLDAQRGESMLRITGSADINGKKVSHEARFAEPVWQVPQNTMIALRSTISQPIASRESAPFALITTSDPAPLTPPGKRQITIQAHRFWPTAKVPITVTLAPLPGWKINNGQPLVIPADKTEVKADLEAPANASPGSYNIILFAVAQIPYNKDPKAAQKPNVGFFYPASRIAINIQPKPK